MIVQCIRVGTNDKAVFFWTENYKYKDDFGNVKEAKRKRFASAAQGETFEVPDECGHDLLAAYKENLIHLHYGSGPVDQAEVKKATSSPRTAMIKEEKDK